MQNISLKRRSIRALTVGKPEVRLKHAPHDKLKTLHRHAKVIVELLTQCTSARPNQVSGVALLRHADVGSAARIKDAHVLLQLAERLPSVSELLPLSHHERQQLLREALAALDVAQAKLLLPQQRRVNKIDSWNDFTLFNCWHLGTLTHRQ